MSPLAESTRNVWRVIAQAGPDGLTSAQIHAALPFGQELSKLQLSAKLQQVRQAKFVKYPAGERFGVYCIDQFCRTPDHEERPDWLPPAPAAQPKAKASDPDELPDADDTLGKFGKPVPAGTTALLMPAAPASVFTLAQTPIEKVRLAGRTETATAPASHAVLEWKAPAKLPAALDMDAIYLAPCIQLADPPPAAPPPAKERIFLCSIDSDGELYVFSNGSELALDLEHTRKLLHYLDHIRAGEMVLPT